MLILSVVSLLIIIGFLSYVTYFFVTYKQVPPSLSQTAEFPHCYYGFQTVICTTFGFLQFYYPCLYPFSDYGFSAILLNAGCSGLALAGYFSYSPWEETKRNMTIHKFGSLSGGVLIGVFYAVVLGQWLLTLSALTAALLLGYFIPGHGYEREKDNSITFWVEIGLTVIIVKDLISKFLEFI